MASDEQKQFLLNREFETLAIILESVGARTAITLKEYIETRLLQGATEKAIFEELSTDLLSGGRIFGEFRNSIKATMTGTIQKFRDVGEFGSLDLREKKKFRWAAVLVNTCPDCFKRHGEVKTWDAWEAEGLPRSGHTVCKSYCQCMLIPEEYTVLEPIKRS